MSEDLSEQYIKEHSKIWTYTSVTGSDHPCRVEQICNARDKVLCKINKERYDKYEYVIWIDMDSNGWDIDGIINRFTHKGWDVMYANGLENNHYYDLYAIRHSSSLFGPEIIGETFWQTLKPVNIKPHDKLIEIYSAFGGIGTFKKSIFKTESYDCIVNDKVKRI